MTKTNLLLSIAAVLLAGPLQASQVKVVRESNGWQLKVDGKPYIVRGVSYMADKVGEDPNRGTLRDWMDVDDDNDGKIDSPYQSWVDANQNDRQDADEPTVGDFQLMADMGVNTIRIYHHPSDNPAVQSLFTHSAGGVLMFNHAPNKALLRDLFTRYGIRVAMGDELGAYAVGSGAPWNPGTDYRDEQQKKNMRASVTDMVKQFKDEPYILVWVLGNENNYNFTHTNANRYPKEYAEFVNEIAQLIHRLDPNHPVVLANGETQQIRTYAKYAPDVDIFGLNCYRTPNFGFLWSEVASDYKKPVLLTEYGAPHPRFVDGQLDEALQAKQLKTYWCDIENHRAGKNAPGNALGGFVYAWLDNWWQDGKPHSFNTESSSTQWNHEALGLAGQGSGEHSPFERQLRKSYFMYRDLWKSQADSCPAQR